MGRPQWALQEPHMSDTAPPRPENSTAAARVDWVDYAKGFCIIFVVMMH